MFSDPSKVEFKYTFNGWDINFSLSFPVGWGPPTMLDMSALESGHATKLSWGDTKYVWFKYGFPVAFFGISKQEVSIKMTMQTK